MDEKKKKEHVVHLHCNRWEFAAGRAVRGKESTPERNGNSVPCFKFPSSYNSLSFQHIRIVA